MVQNNQNHKTNETEIYNSAQQDHNYVMKQNTKANVICQPVPKTKAINHENGSTKITKNIIKIIQVLIHVTIRAKHAKQ